MFPHKFWPLTSSISIAKILELSEHSMTPWISIRGFWLCLSIQSLRRYLLTSWSFMNSYFTRTCNWEGSRQGVTSARRDHSLSRTLCSCIRIYETWWRKRDVAKCVISSFIAVLYANARFECEWRTGNTERREVVARLTSSCPAREYGHRRRWKPG